MIDPFDLLALGGKFFESFFYNYPAGLFILDAEGRCLACNPFASAMSGYACEELMHQSVYELFGTDMENGKDSLLSSSESAGFAEGLLRQKSGNFIHVRRLGMPVELEAQQTYKFIIVEDVHQQRQQEKELTNLHEMFSFISRESQNVISSYSPDGKFTYVSPSVTSLLGYTPDEVIGKPAVVFNHPEDNVKLAKLRSRLVTEQEGMDSFTGRVRHKEGEYRWYETTVQHIRNNAGEITHAIGVGRDITTRKEAEERISHLAYHDPLTNLPNRRLLNDRLSLTLENANDEPHCLMVLDLDGFKPVNDAYGHGVGDLLLVEIARRLTNLVDKDDFVARLGGDEFTIWLANVANQVECDNRIAQIQSTIAEPVVIDGNELSVRASIGLAFYPQHGDSVGKLMRYADMAMYYVKNGH